MLENKWYKYPLIWGKDFDSLYKSLWFGWWLITWTTYEEDRWPIPREVDIRFQPSL